MCMVVSSATASIVVVLTYCAPMCPTIVPFQLERVIVVVIVTTEVVAN